MEDSKKLHNFDLSTFARAQETLVATNDNAYNGYYNNLLSRERGKNYTEEEVKRIVETGSLEEQQRLSRYFFSKDGYYKQIILHYATLLKYTGILIPNPAIGKSLSTPYIQKKYYSALDYIDRMNSAIFFTECAWKVLVNGCYYGVLTTTEKGTFSVLDLPIGYCRTRFKDIYGNDVIEFNVSYFNSISDKELKNAALSTYPEEVVRAYRKWNRGKRASSWVNIPAEVGICFPMLDGRPFFVNVIPATMQYDAAVETEREKDQEEIRKIIVQKIPHLTDGRLLFEPEEVVEIHKGTVGMVRNNKNTSVLTTYGEVDAIVSRATSENGANSLEKMQQNIYSQAGTSSEIFASTGGNTLETALNNDTAIMMYLANKFARFVTNLINFRYSNANVTFRYMILPITYHNEREYIDNSYKLATAGYSLLVPALAQGFSQKDFLSIKDLENDVLKLTDKLIPPQTAFTQTEGEGAGRPTKKSSEKADKTIQNETSKEKSLTQGGSA